MTTLDPPVRPFGDRLDVRLAVCGLGCAGLAVVAAVAGRAHLMWPALVTALVLLAAAALATTRATTEEVPDVDVR